MKTKPRFIEDLVGLFFPNLCLACRRHLPPHHSVLCLTCQYRLPKTNFHTYPDNPFAERFWGRAPIEAGAAFYYFTKGGKVQHLIHALKYEGRKEVGIQIGQWYGAQLRESPGFSNAEVIVPVPLHPRRQWERGYNQSDCFAEGLSDAMGIPWTPQAMARRRHTATQTHKSRLDRLHNVGELFAIADPHLLEGRHVLLVDDVMTTGATLEACALKLLELPGVRLSMATIAFADS
jgi:ComF family protein